MGCNKPNTLTPNCRCPSCLKGAPSNYIDSGVESSVHAISNYLHILEVIKRSFLQHIRKKVFSVFYVVLYFKPISLLPTNY